jgi:isocitrate/isopropylmalate dehydrogenase
MILAGAALLTYLAGPAAERASKVIVQSVFEALAAGVATHDLGGQATTTGFTDEVIRRMTARMEAEVGAD